MEPEGSLPCSQQPATGLLLLILYPTCCLVKLMWHQAIVFRFRFWGLHTSVPILSHVFQPHFAKIHFNIILSSTPSLLSDLPFRLSNQNCVHISHLTHARYVPHPSHPSWSDHPNNIWWRVEIMQLLITQFSLPSCLFILLRSKYLCNIS
jgi:hypothetical protein